MAKQSASSRRPAAQRGIPQVGDQPRWRADLTPDWDDGSWHGSCNTRPIGRTTLGSAYGDFCVDTAADGGCVYFPVGTVTDQHASASRKSERLHSTPALGANDLGDRTPARRRCNAATMRGDAHADGVARLATDTAAAMARAPRFGANPHRRATQATRRAVTRMPQWQQIRRQALAAMRHITQEQPMPRCVSFPLQTSMRLRGRR